MLAKVLNTPLTWAILRKTWNSWLANVLNISNVVATCSGDKCVCGFCKFLKLQKSERLRNIKFLLDQWKSCFKIVKIFFYFTSEALVIPEILTFLFCFSSLVCLLAGEIKKNRKLNFMTSWNVWRWNQETFCWIPSKV